MMKNNSNRGGTPGLMMIILIIIIAVVAMAASLSRQGDGGSANNEVVTPKGIEYETYSLRVGQPLTFYVSGIGTDKNWTLKNARSEFNLDVVKIDDNTTRIFIEAVDPMDNELIDAALQSAPMLSWEERPGSMNDLQINIPFSIIEKNEKEEGLTVIQLDGRTVQKLPSYTEGDWQEMPVAYIE